MKTAVKNIKFLSAAVLAAFFAVQNAGAFGATSCGVNETRNGDGECVVKPPNGPAFYFPLTGDEQGENAAKTAAGLLLGSIVHSMGARDGHFSFKPDYAFSLDGGGPASFYGSRLDYESGAFSAYWSIGRRRGGPKTDVWNYAAGAEYGRDFWKIGYTSRIFGDETDIELSVSASETSGIFRYYSGIIGAYRVEDSSGGFAVFWRNSLAVALGDWLLVPSANFRWNGGDILDGGYVRMDLHREF